MSHLPQRSESHMSREVLEPRLSRHHLAVRRSRSRNRGTRGVGYVPQFYKLFSCLVWSCTYAGVQPAGARGRGGRRAGGGRGGIGAGAPLPLPPRASPAYRGPRDAATRATREATGHSTAPKRGSGSTRIRGRPTSSPAASSPQQRLSTETAALSPSTQYSPG